jgi:chemotaxis protein methyltransferase CheR
LPPLQPPPSPELEDLEIQQLIQAIYRHYGYDFRRYAFGSIRRRIREQVRHERLRTVSGLQEKVLHEPEAMERLLLHLSVNTSSMFRDPSFWLAFRQKVVPLLRTYPFLRIWHAGCSKGEEVYSMAILLTEEGLYDRTRIYATDMNESVLRAAQEGIYSLNAMRTYTASYLHAGGARSFSEYYTAQYEAAIFRAELRRNVVFAQHNLASDGPFQEFQVVLCRNVLIYFDDDLQTHAQQLFHDSLVPLGFLALGAKESLTGGSDSGYRDFDAHARIYRRQA